MESGKHIYPLQIIIQCMKVIDFLIYMKQNS